MSFRRDTYQHGEWFLAERTPAGVWYRCRLNKSRSKADRYSLRTKDYRTACERFDDWFRDNHRPRQAQRSSITLARILGAYYQDHAQHLKTKKAAALHIDLWLQFWGDSLLSDVADRARQSQFRDWLADGKSWAYVQRILSTGKAAINRAEKVGIIAEREGVRIVDIGRRRQTGAKPKGRPLAPAEIAALIDAIGPRANHLYRMILLLLATYARPETLYDLCGEQFDFQIGAIDLNAPGREQNNKHRPIVRLPWFARQYFKGLGSGCYATSGTTMYIGDMKNSRRATVRRAGLTGKVTFYSLRHTGGRYMRSRGVQPWEASAQLGHLAREAPTLEQHYAPASPDYLAGALAAIEALFDEVLQHSNRLQQDFGQATVALRAYG